MGNTESRLKEEKRILHRPQRGEASEFYWACRNGNVDRVKEILKNISYEDLNRLEPNGSTPLHAASYCGQVEIVRILLHERGCRRDCLNRHGLTAYEEAFSEEIRQLFHRPGERNRFCDEEGGIENMFKVTTKEEVEDEDISEEFIKDQWLRSYGTAEEIEQLKREVASLKTASHYVLLTILCNCSSVQQSLIEGLHKFIIEHVSEQDTLFERSKTLAEEAFKEQKPERLLQLYTLETPFYRALSNQTLLDNMFFPLCCTLCKLQSRYFQGVSYRGVKMTNEDLHAYQWALKKNGAILTLNFSSTSIDRSVAERFSGESNIGDEKRSVLMIFNFAEKCDTAINLQKISDQLPCLSEYPNEAEVLLLPTTIFFVKHIETVNNALTIRLEHVPVKRNSLLSALKLAYDLKKKTLRR